MELYGFHVSLVVLLVDVSAVVITAVSQNVNHNTTTTPKNGKVFTWFLIPTTCSGSTALTD